MTADKEFDSLAHHAERSAKIRDEFNDNARQEEQAEAQRAAHRAEQREQTIQTEEKRVTDLIPPGMTRDQLLDRIRAMRNEKPPEVPHDYYISPAQRERLEAEQKAGREAVARAEAEEAKYREYRLKAEAEERAKQVTLTPVHHPNPGMDEQYPAIKATLGKVKK